MSDQWPDLQVDMYSLGVVLWELITTEVPRRGRLRAMKVQQLTCCRQMSMHDVCKSSSVSHLQTGSLKTG